MPCIAFGKSLIRRRNDMAKRRKCKHQGFAYALYGTNHIKIICDWDGKIHPQEYCKQCKLYDPWKNNDTENNSKADG